MPKDSSAVPTPLSTSEFLSALERSGVLSETIWRALLDRLGQAADVNDGLALARSNSSTRGRSRSSRPGGS